jgi:hypothetical protein
MTVTHDNWLVKGPIELSRTGPGNLVYDRNSAGFPVGGVRTKHEFQFEMGAGTVEIETLGPNDAWATLPTGGPHNTGALVYVEEVAAAYRFVFAGAGADARTVDIKSHAVGW